MTNLIQAGDIQMAYRLDGPADAPVVCLNHCFTTDHRFWDLTAPALDEYRVLRYDSRGHGASDKPAGDYSLSQMAGDVAALLDALDIARVDFCGVSMGGMIGQTLTLEHPDRVRSLTICNTPCQYDDDQLVAWRERADLVLEKGIDAVHAGLMARWFTEDARDKQLPGYTYVDDVMRDFKPECFASATAAMCGLNTTQRLGEIKQPVLMIASSDDPGVPIAVAKMMAEKINDAQLEWIDPSRHLSTMEHPSVFNELLVKFLARVHA